MNSSLSTARIQETDLQIKYNAISQLGECVVQFSAYKLLTLGCFLDVPNTRNGPLKTGNDANCQFKAVITGF